MIIDLVINRESQSDDKDALPSSWNAIRVIVIEAILNFQEDADTSVAFVTKWKYFIKGQKALNFFINIKSAVMVYTCISQVKYLILYCNGQKSSFLYLSHTFFRWKWQWISKKDLVNKSHKFYLLTFFLKNKKCAEQTFILTINICCRVNWFNDIQKGDLCF